MSDWDDMCARYDDPERRPRPMPERNEGDRQASLRQFRAMAEAGAFPTHGEAVRAFHNMFGSDEDDALPLPTPAATESTAPVPADPEPPHDGHTIDAGVPTYVGPVRSADPEPEGAAEGSVCGECRHAPHRGRRCTASVDIPWKRCPCDLRPTDAPSEPVGVTRTARDVLPGLLVSGFIGAGPDSEEKAQRGSDLLLGALSAAGFSIVPTAEVTALRAHLVEVVGVLDAEMTYSDSFVCPQPLMDAFMRARAALGAEAPAEDEGDGANNDLCFDRSHVRDPGTDACVSCGVPLPVIDPANAPRPEQGADKG